MYLKGSLSSHSLGFHLVNVHVYTCMCVLRGGAASFDLHSFIVALNIIDRYFVSHLLNMHIHQLASYKSKEKLSNAKFLVHCIYLSFSVELLLTLKGTELTMLDWSFRIFILLP